MELYVGLFVLFFLLIVISLVRLNEAMNRVTEMGKKLTKITKVDVKKNLNIEPGSNARLIEQIRLKIQLLTDDNDTDSSGRGG